MAPASPRIAPIFRLAWVLCALATGCAQQIGPGWTEVSPGLFCRGTICQRGAPSAAASAGPVARQGSTAGIEAQDRIDRFMRLASQSGEDAPRVDVLFAAPGTSADMAGPVPVVHVVFAERVFFDFDSDQPRPDSASVLQLVAENMRHDVPDAMVTVLGHTDAVGSAEYNVALSKRRAETVLQQLIGDRVNPDQLSTVAIGKAQPIASNATAEGRALNRRVEFLISPSLAANLDVVSQQPVNAAFLEPDERSSPRRFAVYKPDAAAPRDTLRSLDDIVLRAPIEPEVSQAHPSAPAGVAVAAPAPVVRKPEAVRRATLNTPEQYEKRELSPDTTY